MGDPKTMADVIAQKVIEREEKKSQVEINRIKQDEAIRARLAKKIAEATIVKKPVFWWLPAFFRTRLQAEDQISKLNRSLLDYAEFCTKQSADMKRLFKLCIDNIPDTVEEWTTLRDKLDPYGVYSGKAQLVGEDE